MKNFDRIPKPPKDRRTSQKPQKPDLVKTIMDCHKWIKYCMGTLYEKNLEEKHGK